MSVERLVGLLVTDDEKYQLYREGMLPLLKEHGGGFGYDFKISEVLKSEVDEPINRVFTIFFRDEESMNSFFSNEEYLKVRQQYFDASVSAATVIATYTK